LIWPAAKPQVEIPPVPQLAVCPAKPDVEGDVVNGKVMLSLADAQRLQQWIHDYQVCSESNLALMNGYAEKLLNRLKAVSQ